MMGVPVSEMTKGEALVPPGFRRIEEGNAVLVAREEFAEAAHRVFAPLYQAWARIAQRRFTAQGRAGIVSFPLGKDLPAMMVRRYVHGGLFARVGRDLYWDMDRALMELIVAESAKRGGVRTPDPIGVLGQRMYGPFWRLAFLSVEVTESEDLIHYGCRLSEYPPETAALEKRGVIREAALQIRKMHDLGIDHADLHLKNLLLRRRADATPEVYLLDFDRASSGPPLDAERRLKNLKRLARSVRKVRIADTVLTAWDRLRFVREYVRGHPDAHALMRRWAKRLASSGRTHEAWWTATGAKRNLRGDGLGTLAGPRSMGTRR
jgi:tRNA A-37 threonylcarbamoyl transferase component Bud32